MDSGLLVQQVEKNYFHDNKIIPVLKAVNLKLPKGRSAAVMGPSGSGKSTLLTLLGGLDRASSGRIVIGGQDITQLEDEALTAFRGNNIGIVFQNYHLMPYLTALENVSLALEIIGERESLARAQEVLEQVGLNHRLRHFPHQLSGGECQRVAIARAIVTRPHLLLADEPSGNLDDKTGGEVTNLLFDIIASYKITSLIVTHSSSLAKLCDDRYQLNGGILKAEGASVEVN